MTASWPLLVDEQERLEALRALEVLGGEREERFDRVTRLATRSLSVPVALVSLLDEDTQRVKSSIGIEEPAIPRSESLCAHTIQQPGVLLVPDARQDPRFRDFPVVTGPPYVRAYAGQSLVVAGRRVGTLSVMDYVPRVFTEDEVAALVDLAHWAETELRARNSQRVARELDELQRRTEMVLAGVAEGVLGTDADGVISFANTAAGELLGRPSRDLLGRDFHRTLHCEDARELHPAAECPLRQTLERGRRHRLLRDDFWSRDRGAVPMDWSTGPVCDEREVVGAVVVFEDVTRRVEVERVKDEFVSVVSHELRTPLTALRGSLGLLLAGLLGEDASAEARTLVQMAHDNAVRLGRLVDDILDLDRAGRGALTYTRRRLEVPTLLETAAETVHGAAVAAGVELDVEPFDAVVWADEYRINQALTNLLGNAIRFSPPQGRVLLHGEADDYAVRIKVTDEGPGIPEHAQSRLFDRFWQVDSSDSRARGGTGLGLAIAKSIVESHGGWIVVDSKPGEGSTFTLALPLRAQNLRVDPDHRRSAEASAGGSAGPVEERPGVVS